MDSKSHRQRKYIFAIKIAEANGDQLSNATYDIMLFKGDIHLDETHRAGEKAAQ
jgi:hypothetical protein